MSPDQTTAHQVDRDRVIRDLAGAQAGIDEPVL
jgi:hypothetical protein